MRISSARLATGLLATTALVVGAIEIEANVAARSELRSFLDRNPGARVASMFAEPFTGRLTLAGVEVGREASRVSIGRLVLPLPRPSFGFISPAAASPFDDEPAEPPAAAPEQATPIPAPATPAAPAPTATAGNGAASAENISITSGQTTMRIKRIDMTGTSLTGADIAALVDPKSPEPLEARFKKLTATAIVVPEILFDDATPGSEKHIAVNQVLLSGAVAGKIAAGSANGISLTSKQGDTNNNGAISAIQASSVDLVQFARVFQTVRSDDAEPIRPLYDSVTVTGLTVGDDKKQTAISLGTLKETGLKGRPLASDFITGASTRKEKLTKAQEAAAFADMTSSFEIGSLEANDFSVHTPGDDGQADFSLASVAMRGFAKTKVGSFTMRALKFDSQKVKFGIGTVDVGAFSLPKPKTGADGAPDPKSVVPSVPKADIGQIDFDVVTPDKESGEPQRVQFKLGHVGIVGDGDPGEIPRSSKLVIENLSFDIPPKASQSKALIDMGYQHLDMSAGLGLTYDADAQDLKIDDLMVNGTNMGSVDLGLHLANVSKGITSSDKEVQQASAMAVLVKGLSLNVINAGLFQRALAWKAKQDGISSDEERAFAVDFFSTKLPAIVNDHPKAKLVGSTIAKFVADPKNLHISIESKSGLGAASMALMANPGLLLDALDVKASAND